MTSECVVNEIKCMRKFFIKQFKKNIKHKKNNCIYGKIKRACLKTDTFFMYIFQYKRYSAAVFPGGHLHILLAPG